MKRGGLIVTPAPHLHKGMTIERIMWSVVIALTPALIGAIYFFGFYVLWITLLSVGSALTGEVVAQKFFGRDITIRDGSAIVTGMLLAFNLPPSVPLWMPLVGSFFAIIVVKQFFGGLGHNFLNPALAARAFLMASWPLFMTDFSQITVRNGFVSGVNYIQKPELLDDVTKATPLTVAKASQRVLSDTTLVEKWGVAQETIRQLNSPQTIKRLFLGNVGGVTGETSVFLLLLGALFLLRTGIINLRIPLSYIGTFFLLTTIGHLFGWTPLNPVFHIFAGGLILGAFFMATDYVTSPVTPKGQWIFGIGCGTLTFLIRLLGGYPEGVSYSILLMNVATPLIDKHTYPRIFGEK